MSRAHINTKFDEGRLAQVLVAPIVSEKATMIAEKRNQVLFKVLRDATKPEIKAAVELMFKVEVASVQTVTQKGKVKKFGRSIGRRDREASATSRLSKLCPANRPAISRMVVPELPQSISAAGAVRTRFFP